MHSSGGGDEAFEPDRKKGGKKGGSEEEEQGGTEKQERVKVYRKGNTASRISKHMKNKHEGGAER